MRRIYPDKQTARRASYERWKARGGRSEAEKAKISKKNHERRVKWRLEALAHYGSVCANCGHDDIRVLQFDHINNDGHLERRDKNGKYRGGGLHPEEALMRGQKSWTDFQILCANCNWLKHLATKEVKH